jgi:hypothetical protein
MSWNDQDDRARRRRGTVHRDRGDSSGLVAALVVTALLVAGVLAARQWWMQGRDFPAEPASGAVADSPTAVADGRSRPGDAQRGAPVQAQARAAQDAAIPTANRPSPDRVAGERASSGAQDAAAVAYAAGRGAADLARPLAQGYVDGAMAGFHEEVARQRAELRRQQIASIRVSGVMLTAKGGHLIVDRDPGTLDDSGPHLCRLAALVAPEPISGRELIVSVGQPGRPQGVVGSLRC